MAKLNVDEVRQASWAGCYNYIERLIIFWQYEITSERSHNIERFSLFLNIPLVRVSKFLEATAYHLRKSFQRCSVFQRCWQRVLYHLKYYHPQSGIFVILSNFSGI